MAQVRCSNCGKTFELDAERFRLTPLIRWAERVIAGELEAWCPVCAEEGERRHDEEVMREERRAVRELRLVRSGIPESLRNPFDDLDRTESGTRARVVTQAGVWSKTGGGLLLTGPVGVGKTFIAGAAAYAATWTRNVRWVSVARLLLGLRAPFSSPDYHAALRALSPAGRPALVLDDLDKTRANPQELQPIFVALDTWIVEGLPLLVTLNSDLDDLERDWGEWGAPVASRLEGYCEIGRLEGRDRRAAA